MTSGRFIFTDVVGTVSSAHRTRTFVLAPSTVAFARLLDWATPVTPDVGSNKSQLPPVGNGHLLDKITAPSPRDSKLVMVPPTLKIVFGIAPPSKGF